MLLKSKLLIQVTKHCFCERCECFKSEYKCAVEINPPFDLGNEKKKGFKMVPFKNRPKFRQQKWYHFKKYLKFLNKNGIILEKVQILLTKMVPYSRILLNPLQPRKNQPL